MIRKLTKEDFCPECDTVLFMEEADFEEETVGWCCPDCDWYEKRPIKTTKNR